MARVSPHHAAIAAAVLTAATLAGQFSAGSVPAHCVVSGPLPDRGCTPGALNPSVTQANIKTTICVQGYTKTIRPPVSYTNPLKTRLMAAYGERGSASAYELDHLISLELGGNPTSPRNLWPEPYSPTPGAHEKDKVENYLHQQVCGGLMTLAEAQRIISTDWTRELGHVK
ncbi:MAG TPA: hypothetical protein VFP86_07830 [bacterium]|nr:hypothetical protein [bacterium]